MAREYVTASQKRKIEQRAHYRCEYCKCHKDFASHTFNVEHIIPVSAGGETTMKNLALACSGCNGCKASRTQAVDPLSKVKANLFHPRQQLWHDHFIWSLDSLKIIGITPSGRATVEALRLNRTGVTNLRSIMLPAGLHPPYEDK